MSSPDQGRHAVARLRRWAEEASSAQSGDDRRSRGRLAEQAKGSLKLTGEKVADAFRP